MHQCQPACKASANEVCKFFPSQTLASASDASPVGSFGCACRAGYQLVATSSPSSPESRVCERVQSYVVQLRLHQLGDSPAHFKRELADKHSLAFRSLARVVREQVRRAYLTSEVTRDRFVTADVTSFAREPFVEASTGASSSWSSWPPVELPDASASSTVAAQRGLVASVTVHLRAASSLPQADDSTSSVAIDELVLRDELTKRLNLRQAAASLAAAAVALGADSQPDNSADNSSLASSSSSSSLFLADVEAVADLDECSHGSLNDCHEAAACINEPGSYRCECVDFADLNPSAPGTQCAAELKSCAYCNHRGDCVRQQVSSSNSNSNSTQSFATVCHCSRIYLGRRCEMNGVLLVMLLPVLAVLLVVAVCLVVYLCRRWRRRRSGGLGKGFRNMGAFGASAGPGLIGSTLDRKAMLESSSESSEHRAVGGAHRVGALLASADSANYLHHHHHHHLHHLHAAAANATGGIVNAGASIYDAETVSVEHRASVCLFPFTFAPN